MRVVLSILLSGVMSVLCFSAQAQPPDQPAAEWLPKRWLGVRVSPVPFESLELLELDYGVEVVGVEPGSPASRAGIRAGDVLVKLGDRPVYSVERLQWLVQAAPADQEVSLAYYRDGRPSTVMVRPVAPERRQPRAWDWRAPGPGNSYLGIQMQSMTDELRELFGVASGEGVLIVKVDQKSPAQQGGLAVGDVIIRIERKTIRAVGDIYRALDFFDPGDEIVIDIVREKQQQSVSVTLAEPVSPGESSRGYHRWHRDFYGIPELPHPRYWREPMERLLDELEEFWKKMPERRSQEGAAYL